MKNTLQSISLCLLLIATSCQKLVKIDEEKSVGVDIIAQNSTNRIYKDTTAKRSINATRKVKVTSDFELETAVTYVGSGNYLIEAHMSNDIGDRLTYTIKNSSVTIQHQIGSVVYNTSTQSGTFFLPPGNYTITCDMYNEELVGHTYYYASFTIATPPQAPNGTLYLLRYYKYTTGQHFYTTDWQELAAGSQGYTYEGVTCIVYPNADPALKPLYRYYNNSTGEHFYTGNSGSYAGFVSEGITCYLDISPNSYSGNGITTDFIKGLGRYNSSRGHFYTANPSEAAAAGYTLEGIIGYVK